VGSQRSTIGPTATAHDARHGRAHKSTPPGDHHPQRPQQTRRQHGLSSADGELQEHNRAQRNEICQTLRGFPIRMPGGAPANAGDFIGGESRRAKPRPKRFIRAPFGNPLEKTTQRSARTSRSARASTSTRGNVAQKGHLVPRNSGGFRRNHGSNEV